MRSTKTTPRALLAGLTLVIAACGGEAPPATPTPPAPPPAPAVPEGMVMVTVSAASTPAGATVTGGGSLLGTTPFVTQVPVPAPAAGATQTFEFTFLLPGYTATTVTASPVNSTINLNAVLAPIVAATPPGLGVAPPGTTPTGTLPPGTVPPPGVDGPPPGTHFTVRGHGGGRIFDNHTTTATAEVGGSCRIGALRIDIDGNHTYHSDLIVRLTSPSGETFTLQNHARRNPFRSHTVTRARGSMTNGRWTLAIEDTVGADSGNLAGFTLDITCG